MWDVLTQSAGSQSSWSWSKHNRFCSVATGLTLVSWSFTCHPSSWPQASCGERKWTSVYYHYIGDYFSNSCDRWRWLLLLILYPIDTWLICNNLYFTLPIFVGVFEVDDQLISFIISDFSFKTKPTNICVQLFILCILFLCCSVFSPSVTEVTSCCCIRQTNRFSNDQDIIKLRNPPAEGCFIPRMHLELHSHYVMICCFNNQELNTNA